MKMRRALAAIMAAVMGLSLAGCGSSAGTDSTAAANGAAAADDGKVVINFFHRWPNDPKNSMFKELVQEYMDENPNVVINMDCILNDQYKEKIRMVVSTDEVPDIFSSWSGTFAQEMIASGNVASVNDM